ncbi:MAG: DUF222 domain-containing protein [Solirubrobacterales bacterium]
MFDTSKDDPASISTDHLEERIAGLAAEIFAATRHWLHLIAEFDRRGAYEQWGMSTCSQWLSWRCGIAERAAREHVRVARALGELPKIDATFAAGEISYSKVRALTRVASGEDETELLELAGSATAAQLERLVRAYRGVLEPERAELAFKERFFNWSWEEDGSLSFSGRLPAEGGAVLMRAIEAAGDRLRDDAFHEENGSAEPVRSAGGEQILVTNADAVVAMGESALCSPGAVRSGGERYQLVVHIEPSVLTGESADGRCATDDGSRLAAETARRLACDAGIVPIVERGGRALSVGRRTRSIPAAIGRALRARDDGCRFPGCANKRFVDGHHLEHWANGGETCLENLVSLCRRHHRLVHEGGFTVEACKGSRFRFRRPDGSVIPPVPGLSRVEARRQACERPELRASSPNGSSMDADHVLGTLLSAKGPAKRVQRSENGPRSP